MDGLDLLWDQRTAFKMRVQAVRKYTFLHALFLLDLELQHINRIQPAPRNFYGNFLLIGIAQVSFLHVDCKASKVFVKL